MRRAFFILLSLLIVTTFASANIFISQPTDKNETFKEVFELKGDLGDPASLKVNNIPIPFLKTGGFSCGLVLKAGKNLVEVKAENIEGDIFKEHLRLLRMQTYLDVEELNDRGEKHWARKAIIYLSTLGLIEGFPDKNFYPSRAISRGELATWIARVADLLPEFDLTEDVFYDVPKEHWRAAHIKAVVDAGYMTSYSDTLFGLEDPVTRRDAARIAVVSAGLGNQAPGYGRPFMDVPENDPGFKYISIAKKNNLIKGVSDTISFYDPERSITRAEAAILLYRFKEAQKKVWDLFNFDKGYSVDDFCKINVAPKILAFRVMPNSVKLGKETIVHLEVAVAPRQTFYPISLVRVDLSQIGGMPDTELFDNGKKGDAKADDLIYSLNVTVLPEKEDEDEEEIIGEKIMEVLVIDRLGWEAKDFAILEIIE